MHRLADASAVHLPSACMSSACMSSRGIVDHLATTVHRHAASPSRPYIGKTARESAGASSMSPRRSSRPQSCIQLVTSVSAQKMEGGSGPAGSEEPARRKRAGGGLKDGGSIDREAGSGKAPGSRRLRPAPAPAPARVPLHIHRQPGITGMQSGIDTILSATAAILGRNGCRVYNCHLGTRTHLVAQPPSTVV